MKVRSSAIALAVLALAMAGTAPAYAANPYNATGYMNTTGDYAGVYVQNSGAGVIAVRATIQYAPPTSGGTTYETSTFVDTTVQAGYPVTTGTPAYGIQYSHVLKFRGCSGSGSSCTLGSWDSNATAHVFS